MISDQRNVQHHREPFTGQQKDAVENDVENVFRQDQLESKNKELKKIYFILCNATSHRIQAVALIDGVLVIRLQLVEDDHMEDGKEDEDGVRNQSDHVRNGRKIEGHFKFWANLQSYNTPDRI